MNDVFMSITRMCQWSCGVQMFKFQISFVFSLSLSPSFLFDELNPRSSLYGLANFLVSHSIVNIVHSSTPDKVGIKFIDNIAIAVQYSPIRKFVKRTNVWHNHSEQRTPFDFIKITWCRAWDEDNPKKTVN